MITSSVKCGGNREVTLKVETDDAHLVQTLSHRWGVYERSTPVGFEIDRTPDGAR